MKLLAAIAGIALVTIVLSDAFETIVLPRRVVRRLRLARLFYRYTWLPCSAIGRRIDEGGGRERFLGYYGPLSLIVLTVVWAVALLCGFALLQWGVSTKLAGADGTGRFGSYLYMSGTTLFTLGLGDVTPVSPLGRALTVIEAGTGLGFLALVISYLPTLYQSFSRRETIISLLDARAGSPPTAVALLSRCGIDNAIAEIGPLLAEWEQWSADLLESHLSYPLLAYFRSQHEHQSWPAALTAVLDTCALVIAGIDSVPLRPARLAFAMARHTAVDLSETLSAEPERAVPDRLPPERLVQVREALQAAGVPLRAGAEVDAKLAELRRQYEPYVVAIANRFLMPLPPWLPAANAHDAWQMTAWEGNAAQTP